MIMKIKTLPREFLKKGFLHTQLERAGQIAMFQRGKNGRVHYEVVKIRTHKPHPDFVSEFDLVESYPASEDWGYLGFTYKDLESATEKFLALRRRQGGSYDPSGAQNASDAIQGSKNEPIR
jgi:hypothetical protein